MIQLILKDVKSLRLIQTENVYAGENKISEFSVILPEKITQYKTADCEIEMRSFVSEDRYISTRIDTSTRNPKVPITTDLTEKAQIVPIMFFITHEGNVIGKTNFEKLNVLESKDGSAPLDPREELDEIIAELRAKNAAQAQTISSQSTTIEQQSGRILELNSEVDDLSAENELLRDTVDTFNKSEPKLETPDIITPSGETQLITPDTSKGYVGLKSVTVDRVTAKGTGFRADYYKKDAVYLDEVATYNPFPYESKGGIYILEKNEDGHARKWLFLNLILPTVFPAEFFINSVESKGALKEVIFENCSGVETLNPYMFQGTAIEKIVFPKNLINIGFRLCYECVSLKTVQLFNKIQNASQAFLGCPKLEFVTIETGFNADGLNLSASTLYSHDTILSWFNALADRTGEEAYTLTIGSTNLAKLTAEQIAIATNKNWNLA